MSQFSPRYAAPEQHPGEHVCGFETDIWQIGMVFAELLTGKSEIPSGDEPVFLGEEGAGVLRGIRRYPATMPGAGIHLPLHSG